MQDSARIEPQMLRTEQVSEAKADEKPWERQKNEPARWYMRFQIYLKMGAKRSLRAAIASELPGDQATKGDKKQHKSLSDVSVPGSWSRSAKLWHWVERACAYDLHIAEVQARAMRMVAANYPYSSRARRLVELNNLVIELKAKMNLAFEAKDCAAIVARIQSLFHDIDAEMDKLGMQDEADASALISFIKQAVNEGDTELLKKLKE